MHVIVCIKSVPETTEVQFDLRTGAMLREGVRAIVNPFDMFAIEESLRLVEAHGGQVTALCMGPPQAERELREALALGCHQAILLSDRAFAGSDTWATAYALSKAIRALGPVDLVLCGKQAIDGDTGQVGPGIANQLGLPQLTYVWRIRQVDMAARRIVVERMLEEGAEIVAAPLPAVVTVLKGINIPRYPTRRRLRRARAAQIPVWTPQQLDGADPGLLGLDGSPTQVVRIFTPPRRSGQVRMLNGDSLEQAVAALVEQMRAERVI